jgi:hypothetical protein
MSSIGYSCHILMKFEFSGQIFKKYSNIKFRERPCSGSRFVPYGQKDRRADTTITNRKFANAPKNYQHDALCLSVILQLLYHCTFQIQGTGIGTSTEIPVQVWTGLEGSRRLRLPSLKTNGI